MDVKVNTIAPESVSESTRVSGIQDFDDAVLDGVHHLLMQHGLCLNPNILRYGAPLQNGRVSFETLPDLLARQDIAARVGKLKLQQITETLLPCLLLTRDGRSLVLVEFTDANNCVVVNPMTSGQMTLSRDDLDSLHDGRVLFAHPHHQQVRRAAGYSSDPKAHWFRSRVKAQWKNFLEIALASMLAALLSIATALFAMQVYDRVVPTQATETLWALAIGVFIAIIFEFMLRSLRAQLIESNGKQLDLALSRHLFDQAINLKYSSKPGSTGAFASQIRDFEVVREFFTASTMGAFGDLPFTLLFIALIAFIAGPLALVPATAILLMIVPSLLVQPVVARLSRDGMREAAIKNAVLLESMDHMETVKANSAEGRALGIWQRLTAEQTARGVSARNISAWLNSWASAIQQVSYISTVLGGVYLIFNGQLTIGALIACSILTSRAVAPTAQVSHLLARWQQVKVALEGLEDLMQRPVERPVGRQFVRLSSARGQYSLESVQWRCDSKTPSIVNLDRCEINSGEHWALLGGNGAGKSTLLRLLAGLYDPTEGSLRLDGLELSQLDPADKRHHIGYMPQDVALFHGTLRDNLTLDGRSRNDGYLMDALDLAGLGDFVRRHPRGLDMFIAGNQSLSGGQRQAVGLTRVIVQDSPIVLLDEPTAAFDQRTENVVISNMQTWLQNRTLVIATHKLPMLSLCDHALVLQGGKRVLDGSIETVLKGMNFIPKAATAKASRAS